MPPINPHFQDAMQALWRKRYPHAPWLMSCWQQAWQAMQAGDDYVTYEEAAEDETRRPPWADANALNAKLPMLRIAIDDMAALCQQGDFQALWRSQGAPPWVLVEDTRHATRHYRLYTAATFADEWAINAALFARFTLSLTSSTSDIPTLPTPTAPSASPSFNWQVDQQLAITAAQEARTLILTGGPGSGKTTVITQILMNALGSGIPPEAIALAAPSGKAAERINGALQARAIQGLAATTLDRLLGLGFNAVPAFHALRPLPYRLIIVDECSMINVRRFAQLFRALPPSSPTDSPTTLILCGDPYQLAAVEHGEVFRRLAELGTHLARAPNPPSRLKPHHASLRWVHLAGNQRARHSALIECAAHIQDGEETAWQNWWSRLPAPPATLNLGLANDATSGVFRLLPSQTLLHEVQHALQGLIAAYLVQLESLLANASDPADSPADSPAQIAQSLGAWWQGHRFLCAQKVGVGGTRALNRQALALIQTWLNAHPAYATLLPQDETTLPLINGTVVQLQRNLPSLGLSNGATGIIWQGNLWFPTRQPAPSPYAKTTPTEAVWQAMPTRLLQDCDWGFAITVHKSQGSEFKHVWLVIPPKSRVLNREVLYTGATRAQTSLTLYAEAPTLTQAINHPERRQCGVADVNLLLNHLH